MLLEFLTASIPAFGAAVGAFLAVFSLRWMRRPHKPVKVSEDGHEHVYDTMTNDGKGWRCGICQHPMIGSNRRWKLG